MNLNELVSYIEELTFRTTMFGYDRDEVDVQLDKINDEIMALVKAKDAEIAALKKGEVLVEAEDLPGDKPSAAAGEEEDGEGILLYPEPEESVDLSDKEEGEASPDAEELEALLSKNREAEARIADLEQKVRDLSQALEEVTLRAERAEDQVDKAAERSHAFAARVDELEGLLAEKEAVRADIPEADEEEDEDDGPAVLLLNEETEETTEPEKVMPATTDEAYNQYMRNADLLCRQLSLIDDQKESVLSEARGQAEDILSQAKGQADTILEEANVQAQIIVDQANDQAEDVRREMEEQREKILEEAYSQRDEEIANIEADKALYAELVSKKASILQTLRDLSEEALALAEDYDDEEDGYDEAGEEEKEAGADNEAADGC